MVTFISQCEKKALNRTRRVLDSFANRIGDNSWQTVITNEGLNAVKKLLRKTASKNTAVSCFWIRSRSRSELVWVVGNKDKFNSEGFVPVNSTELDMNKFMDSNQWGSIKLIQYAASIAGLFHDFGKANTLFQRKLQPGYNGNKYEPYRHEWVSLRLFEAFVRGKSDIDWLEELTAGDSVYLNQMFDKTVKDGIERAINANPLIGLASFSQLVGWLILTHHKLPSYPIWKENSPPSLSEVDEWFEVNFEATWNSNNCKEPDITKEQLEKNWQYEYGLPVESMQWRSMACLLATEALSVLRPLLQGNHSVNLIKEHVFTTHMARLCLMFADHHYSSLSVTSEWQNRNYNAYANTDRETKECKQKLDEHLIGVSHHAAKIAKALPKLNTTLRSLEINSVLTENVAEKHKENFGWQDNAKQQASEISKITVSQGFFGINMASTGKGKTLANAKIMYALAGETGRRRYSVALGLRTLTLQTGKEYREKLGLTENELAILVGGEAVKNLFEFNHSKEYKRTIHTGLEEAMREEALEWSESKLSLLSDDMHVIYKGDLYQHSLSDWINPKDKNGEQKDSRIDKLIQSPVLVSTIDHLMPATEGTRGGKQIGSMLRLLTSELILDEPDDFGLDDLPALCRLVNWAGMLGSRVLLSSATIPPALANALYQAYQEGWKQFSLANNPEWKNEIACAWFDEFGCDSESLSSASSFQERHYKFVKNRIKELKKKTNPKRKGKLIDVKKTQGESTEKTMAVAIRRSIVQLHENHHQSQSGKNISIGLVRMANINPLVAVAKELFKIIVPDDTCIHYCVYHSRYPLAIRSHLEKKLDTILFRENPERIWHEDSIKDALKMHKQSNHIFVVLASPVAEVGRDHDYDWAVVEPSSMRSIIQLAGRVLRHRHKIPETPNIYLLSKNYKGLESKYICFNRPGFESKPLLLLASKDLKEILKLEQYESIDSVTRITLPKFYETVKEEFKNLVELEHKALAHCLVSKENSKAANVWWRTTPHWCGEVQRQQRFRNSKPDESYYQFLEDENSEPFWQWKNNNVYPCQFGICENINNQISDDINLSAGNNFWFELNINEIYMELSVYFEIDLKTVSARFGEVRLVDFGSDNQNKFSYHPLLGVYTEISRG